MTEENKNELLVDTEQPKRMFISLDILKKKKENNLNGPYRLKMCAANNPNKPKSSSLRAKWPPIYDQGPIGSCTANAFCSVFKYLQDDTSFEPSRLFFYYKERLMETKNGKITDSGAFVSDGCDYASRFGICSEKIWPYLVENVNDPPPTSCDIDAKRHRIGKFISLSLRENVINSIESCLNQNLPVMLAFGVYKSFEKVKSDGIVPVPHPHRYENPYDSSDAFEGGHEVVIIGYDSEKKLFEIANSWGERFGDKGFCYFPYSFISNDSLVYDLSVVLDQF